jgi:hypothetical protein
MPLCGAALTFFVPQGLPSGRRRKESKQRKRACNRQPVGVPHWHEARVVRAREPPSHPPVSDKGLIRSSVALRAPPSGISPSANCVGVLTMLDCPFAENSSLPSQTTPSLADRSATHVVRSGMNESLVKTSGDARDHFVRAPLRAHLTGGHLQAGGVKPAFFAYFLCGGDPKVVPVGQRK